MKVVITGGAGFLGRRLLQTLLQQGTLGGPWGAAEAIDKIVLLDTMAPPPALTADARVQAITGDITDRALLAEVIDHHTHSVFHFAAVVSAAAEADFDLGMRINLHGTLAVLDACRALPHPPRLLFTSSIASFGGPLPAVVNDSTPQAPENSYGVQKAIGELLVTDYSRKGYVDGRAVRLPTIVVRPGRPNRAASSFASSIIREPLTDLEAVCPVRPETRLAILSPRRAVEAFIRAHDLPAAAFGHTRSLIVPGLSVEVHEMVAALGRAAGQGAVERIRWQPDADIQRIISSWPGAFTSERALQLGFQADATMDAIVQAFIEDDLPEQRSL
ncbi:MAG: SDR family oxidoreductase [Candidatus Tectomicrobia bacterium]|uniref:SDR family oxidoreductase n=1 Tax=Tectimicrobiota bacterium TaxID=2528274 RepID=A0A938B1E3_UNCTE|nr:SDR family oxidoreductase [Candidatus Tectomicrobia bacterium]